jgi:hypothetical protein
MVARSWIKLLKGAKPVPAAMQRMGVLSGLEGRLKPA